MTDEMTAEFEHAWRQLQAAYGVHASIKEAARYIYMSGRVDGVFYESSRNLERTLKGGRA